jgi:hypothetical protein
VEYKRGRFEVLEKSMGNSVAMLSRFYSDADPTVMADELAGFKQRSSVEKNIDKLLAQGTDEQRKFFMRTSLHAG